MPTQARVTSVDAIESFRAALITYLGKARPALEEITGDVVRTRLWLQAEQRAHWMTQIRRRTKALEEAHAAFQSARLANFRDNTMAELQAVRRATRELAEAEEKLRLVKKWTQQFDSAVEPLARQLEHLQTLVSHDLPKAVAYLRQVVGVLDAYAERAPASNQPADVKAAIEGKAGA